jgi:hypothetical protein
MSRQLFKTVMDIRIIYDFLDIINILPTNDAYYVLNKDTFKHAKYIQQIVPFYNKLHQHYHLSKQHYISRNITYKSFLTIIRQICNLHKIPYTYHITYDNSEHNILYKIYKNTTGHDD